MDADGYVDSSAEEARMNLASMMAQMKKLHSISAVSQPRVSIIDFSLHDPQPLQDGAAPPTSATPPCAMYFCGMPIQDAAAVSPVYSRSPSTPPYAAAAIREAAYAAAVMQPVLHVNTGGTGPIRRRNVRVSKDRQSVAARRRRERIRERMWTLRRLVPGGTKMDTASMLDEAIRYLKFLKTQVQSLHWAAAGGVPAPGFLPPPAVVVSGVSYPSFGEKV